MRRHRAILAASVLLLGLIVGCGRVQNERFLSAETAQNSVTIEAALPDELVVGEAAEVQIHVAEAGEPVEGAAVSVEGNMTHAGMEPLFVEAREVAPGEYLAELDWTMGGQWFIVVRATLLDGTTAERRFEFYEVGQ